MSDCHDGIERIYSHGGDVLNDGYVHDAFDCFRLLLWGGDEKNALKWNAEITKHNQRLYMQNKAKNTPPQGDNSSGGAFFPEYKPFPFVSDRSAYTD